MSDIQALEQLLGGEKSSMKIVGIPCKNVLVRILELFLNWSSYIVVEGLSLFDENCWYFLLNHNFLVIELLKLLACH